MERLRTEGDDYQVGSVGLGLYITKGLVEAHLHVILPGDEE